MRLNNFLNENEDNYIIGDFLNIRNGNKIKLSKEIYDIIQKECSEILELYDRVPNFFFRGIESIDNKRIVYSGRNISIYKVIPRKDRIPKDTFMQVQRKIDNLFYKKFGWKPRSEGVFVTPNESNAMDYGEPFVFLPANGYKYIWSPKIEDMFINFTRDYQRKMGDINKYDPKIFKGRLCDIESLECYPTNDNEFVEFYDAFHLIPNFDKIMLENDTNNIKVRLVNVKGQKSELRVFKWIPEIDEKKFTTYVKKITNEQEEALKLTVNKYKSTGLYDALSLSKSNEVMFNCKHYYLITLS